MYLTQKYRLYPTAEQAEKLAQFAGTVRWFYNLALEQRRDFHRQFKRATGQSLNYVTQGREITRVRAAAPWVAETPAQFLHSALRDLDKAFARFFAGGGFPKFRRAGACDGFEVKGRETNVLSLNAKWSSLLIPKIGRVKFRDTRPITGDIRATRIICEGGKWFACVGVRNDFEAPVSSLPVVGVDRGVTLALALSDGRAVAAPAELAALDRRARKAQRLLSRRRRGSGRHAQARRRSAAIKAKAARVRRDWQHKATTAICRVYGGVVIEALATRNMTARARGVGAAQKRGLNRAILNIGWHSIELMLAYKLEQRGGTLIKVNPAYTSQTCSACGAIDRESRESQARFACRSCGHTENADINAARNILRQGLAGVEGAGCGPNEARTIHPRLAA